MRTDPPHRRIRFLRIISYHSRIPSSSRTCLAASTLVSSSKSLQTHPLPSDSRCIRCMGLIYLLNELTYRKRRTYILKSLFYFLTHTCDVYDAVIFSWLPWSLLSLAGSGAFLASLVYHFSIFSCCTRRSAGKYYMIFGGIFSVLQTKHSKITW